MSDAILTIFVLANIALYFSGWIIVITDYIISGNIQRRRICRKILKDESSSQIEKDYAKIVLSIPAILII